MDVSPCVSLELRHWRDRAAAIPDEVLRAAALGTLCDKRDGVEGATAFAAFASRRHRAQAARAIAAFQAALDYLDTIGEMPNPQPLANGRMLNQALVSALTPGSPRSDYYALHARRGGDAGYLAQLVDACRSALCSLPAFERVAQPVQQVVARIAAYQSLNHGDAHGSHVPFAEWAAELAVEGARLDWWEAAAAAGSQLTAFALIAAAADRQLTSERAEAVERAYFPWIAALSTLLDSVVDQCRDNAEGQPNLIDHYRSPQHAAERLGTIAAQAMRRIRSLPDAQHHALLLASMAAFFRAQAQSESACLITQAVLRAIGRQTLPPLLVFRTRDSVARLRKRCLSDRAWLHDR